MNLFEIREIGEEVEATAGVLEGCELCGHCLVMRRSAGPRAALPCGARPGETTPWDEFMLREAGAEEQER